MGGLNLAKGSLTLSIPFIEVKEDNFISKAIEIHCEYLINNLENDLSSLEKYNLNINVINKNSFLENLSSKGSLSSVSVRIGLNLRDFIETLNAKINLKLTELIENQKVEDLKAIVELISASIAKGVKDTIYSFDCPISIEDKIYKIAQKYYQANELIITDRRIRYTVYAGAYNPLTEETVTAYGVEYYMGRHQFLNKKV